MRRLVCPGSFDPVTNGHLDIVGRAARLADEVIVAVLRNPSKIALFTVDERLEMLREVTKEHDNVRVAKFDGLIVDFCKANDVSAIVKGLRAVSDFDYELQMAQMNYNQAGVETLFISIGSNTIVPKSFRKRRRAGPRARSSRRCRRSRSPASRSARSFRSPRSASPVRFRFREPAVSDRIDGAGSRGPRRSRRRCRGAAPA